MPGLSLLAVSLLATPSAADLVTASPDAPALELSWRDGIRAKGGGRIRFLGDGENVTAGFFDFLGFIELHNGPRYHGIIPYEYWRGRFAFEGGFQQRLDGQTPWTLRFTAALEHESDHATTPNVTFAVSDVGFVNLNAVAVQVAARHGNVAPSHAAVTLRLHVVTCTRSQTTCGLGGGTRGDATFEVEGALSQELALWGRLEKWNLFASAWGQVLVATALIAPARRIAFRAGVIRHRTSDSVGVFFQALLGSDVGYFRQLNTVQLGIGISWVPG